MLMTQDVKQLRVKIFDELSKIVDPEINTTITELELVDEVDIADQVKVNVSNHFMAEQINNQVNNSPNPHKKD